MKAIYLLRMRFWWVMLSSGLLIAHSAIFAAGKLPNGFHLVDSQAKRAEVAFHLQRNLMVVKATVNGKGPYNFMLDSGVGTSILTDPSLVAELGLTKGPAFRIAGLGEESAVDAYVSDGIAVRLGHEVEGMVSMLVLSDDVLDLSSYVGMPIHGILGSELFHSLVVEIHPVKDYMVLHQPEKFRKPAGRRWAEINLEMEGAKAYVTVPVQTDSLRMPMRLVLDTGAGHALSLETGSDPRLLLPSARVRSQLGRGLNGFINGYLGRVPQIELGKYQISNLITSFPDAAEARLRANGERHGNLGFDLLKRFDTIIDYAHNRLLLRPNELMKEPFENDMSGIEVLAIGHDYRQFIILKILPDSPAALANLKAGDQIVSVNFQPAGGFTLNNITRLLQLGDGRQVVIVVRRPDGELHSAVVKLKRQI